MAKAKKTKKATPVRSLKARKAKAVKGGKASVQDFSFTHKIDKASPVLF